MDTKIRRLIALFAVISIAGLAFVGFRYVGAGALFGFGPMTVKAQFLEPGGIFPKAAVSYRGVEIGKVGTMRVTPIGVEVELDIDHSAPKVPASAIAVVANRSAVGEQYVDLQPPSNNGPYLQDGSIIPPNQTKTPVAVDALLANLNSLVKSVPLPELRQTIDELDNAFNRTGPPLQRLIDSSNPLVNDAIRNLPQTNRLLQDGRTVLTTQSQLGPQITSFSRDLAVFSAQLKADDPNLRRLVNAAPPAATQLEGLIRETGPDLSRVISNLLVVAQIAAPRQAGIQQLLVTYPVIAAAAPSVVPGDGYVHFGLVLNLNDPPPCRAGYMPVSQWQPATITSYLPFDTSIKCNEGSPINVRGSQNAPQTNGAPGGGDPAAGGGGGAQGPVTPPVSSASPTAGQNQAAMNPLAPNASQPDAGSGGPPVLIPGMG